jgi:hypothetical protein
MTTQASPPGWGSDALTNYLEAFRTNQFATFANKRAAMAELIKIDAMFDRFLNGAINPRPFYPMGFMMRAHSAFRAGVSAVTAGQLFESQGLLRLCLEHAAYGFYIGADKDRMERWLRRGDSEENRKALRKEFHNDKIRGHIEAIAPVMREQFDHHYNQLIEFGAHPNEMGYLLNTTIQRNDADDAHFQTIYLQADGAQLDMGLKVAAQIGLWGLHLMQLLYRERFELLGIRADLEEMRTRF